MSSSIPRPEHPRPQFTRPHWLTLNGEWAVRDRSRRLRSRTGAAHGRAGRHDHRSVRPRVRGVGHREHRLPARRLVPQGRRGARRLGRARCAAALRRRRPRRDRVGQRRRSRPPPRRVQLVHRVARRGRRSRRERDHRRAGAGHPPPSRQARGKQSTWYESTAATTPARPASGRRCGSRRCIRARAPGERHAAACGLVVRRRRRAHAGVGRHGARGDADRRGWRGRLGERERG